MLDIGKLLLRERDLTVEVRCLLIKRFQLIRREILTATCTLQLRQARLTAHLEKRLFLDEIDPSTVRIRTRQARIDFVTTFEFSLKASKTHLKASEAICGSLGITLRPISLAGVRLVEEWQLYYLALAVLTLVLLGVLNLLRAPTGRAFVAIRDSEISAQSMGIGLARYKTASFALSAAITGLAGALYAHKLQFISPEQFGIILSVELAMMIFIGGIGSLHGAIFLIALPQLVAVAKDYLPAAIGHQTGLEPTVFGLILVLVIVFEPQGLYGRWLKVRHYLQTFPLYKRDLFRRQRTFMKSERAR